jgi:alpha-beta hydrolase superfamily lysophospholipase
MHGVVAVAGFVLGALFCLVLAVAEWGGWMLVAPRRRLEVGARVEEPEPGEPIQVTTADGLRLAGVWYPATARISGRTAIVIHGYAEDPRGFRDRARALAARGWNAAALDLRGHGESEREHTSFGGRESDDLHAWIEVLTERIGPAMTLAVWGRSMGAAVALRAAAEDDAAQIAALVLESPYHDLESVIAVLVRRFRLPWPRLLARLIAHRAETLAGVSLTRPRPLDLALNVAVPTLIVHGSNDTLITLDDVRLLAAALPAARPLIEVPGARHTDIIEVGGPALLDRIVLFLEAAAEG